ncbi:hypothetical protein B6N60_04965 [Richelia sinica FACHB-800]|uniref:Uncharacterized protein n=1 Tax=Richelia sinica FACHB-800 TaxID=1357546 RepID=A0A975Y7E3_9NOST|nr:hypothetical protein [Richelia sinica]MBD2666064.1 hypothetical protein [Richelia sinica FACHB-800]QXE26234.1 hypothetical protein B6N60_04965 [Richelia sinica FACHB-800]
MVAIFCATLIFSVPAFADPPRYEKNPDYIAVTKDLSFLQNAKAQQTPLEGYTPEEIDQRISELELQKFAFESGVDWGQCSNQTGKTLAIYGPAGNSQEGNNINPTALYFLGDGQTTKNKWNCKGIYIPADVSAIALGVNGDKQELTGGVVIKVPNGTQLVLKTNQDTGAIEFNQAGTQILQPGEINWFIPNVSQAIVDARIANAPTKKA